MQKAGMRYELHQHQYRKYYMISKCHDIISKVVVSPVTMTWLWEWSLKMIEFSDDFSIK